MSLGVSPNALRRLFPSSPRTPQATFTPPQRTPHRRKRRQSAGLPRGPSGGGGRGRSWPATALRGREGEGWGPLLAPAGAPRTVLMRAARLYSGHGAALAALGCSRADPTQVRDPGRCIGSVPLPVCPGVPHAGPRWHSASGAARTAAVGFSRLRRLPRSAGPCGPRRTSFTPHSPAGPRRSSPCPRPGSLLSASVGTLPSPTPRPLARAEAVATSLSSLRRCVAAAAAAAPVRARRGSG